MAERKYLCIDLKSFYASVECVERGLDPMTTNLVVADPERSDRTICLAITPSMKALGIKNRCRVFQIPEGVKYIVAPPRMQLYIEYSAKIYSVYLEYIAKEDIHVYSVDEAFLDVTDYLTLYKMTPRQLAVRIMEDILKKTGVRATCGIGTNLYLTKIALDITAKHSPDFIGELDEEKFRRELWNYRPLTDFWRIGSGTAKRLEKYGIKTMGELAHTNESLIYRIFGIDAELMIDHAWGRESTTISDIKKYRPKSNSLSSGQVLMCDYSFEDGLIIVKEMMDLLCLDLVDKNLVTDSLSLMVGYTAHAEMPAAKGSTRLEIETNADTVMLPAIEELYKKIVNPKIPVRRINICCNRVEAEICRQYSFFDDVANIEKTRKIQKAVLALKRKYGNDAILKGMNFQENATTRVRNHQIGGHKSGV